VPQAVVLGFDFLVPARSPARLRLIEGTAKQRRTGVAFFLVTFSSAKQEKVTSCRATPDGVEFSESNLASTRSARTDSAV